MSKRDALRAATVGASTKPKHAIVKLAGDLELEVREISVGARERIAKGAQTPVPGAFDADGKPRMDFSVARFNLLTLVECCYEPGTQTRVFEPADVEAMMEAPEASSFVPLLLSAYEGLAPKKDEKANPTSGSTTNTVSAP